MMFLIPWIDLKFSRHRAEDYPRTIRKHKDDCRFCAGVASDWRPYRLTARRLAVSLGAHSF
jgi:hypothetical protein